jgi:hypothetical protein
MPRFLRLGNVWINVDHILEVHVEPHKGGEPMRCRVRLPGETATVLEGENMTRLVEFLQGNELR